MALCRSISAASCQSLGVLRRGRREARAVRGDRVLEISDRAHAQRPAQPRRERRIELGRQLEQEAEREVVIQAARAVVGGDLREPAVRGDRSVLRDDVLGRVLLVAQRRRQRLDHRPRAQRVDPRERALRRRELGDHARFDAGQRRIEPRAADIARAARGDEIRLDLRRAFDNLGVARRERRRARRDPARGRLLPARASSCARCSAARAASAGGASGAASTRSNAARAASGSPVSSAITASPNAGAVPSRSVVTPVAGSAAERAAIGALGMGARGAASSPHAASSASSASKKTGAAPAPEMVPPGGGGSRAPTPSPRPAPWYQARSGDAFLPAARRHGFCKRLSRSRHASRLRAAPPGSPQCTATRATSSR